MAGKSGKPTRRERREERRRERDEARDAERAARRFRARLLVLIALLAAGAAMGVHQLGGPPSVIGLALLAGVGAFLAVLLGGLGGSVRARDRTKASNIDYGS